MRCSSPGVAAVGVGAAEDVAPQLFGDRAGAGVLALPLGHRALGAVPKEEQPPLLLRHILLLLLELLPLLRGQVGQRVLLLPTPLMPIQ